ncbi:MAG: ATP-binding protein [Chitinophagaceae bacterium]
MFITLKTKIWLTILTIVLLFSFFTLYYFPEQQGQAMMKSYKNEVLNYAKTVALGVNIALNEQNYEGVKTAMEYVKGAPGLKFVSLVQVDTLRDKNNNPLGIRETIFKSFPDKYSPDSGLVSNDTIIIKRAPFQTTMMSGDIMLGFNSDEIKKAQWKIRKTSLLVSGGIMLIGLLIGFWLAKNISVPVRALRDAARQVGQGDLTPVIKNFPRDEIGELSKAFNTMVQDISKAREIRNQNLTLTDTNKLLNDTLADLKATQSQLIQSEKMASLGELTAGIAHEIQNPLNFVNNFSELNKELLSEMNEEIGKGNYDEVKEIARDVTENEEKINHHGKRADAIVKGMLQHSRSSGIKEPTNINALADEYLRLAYHGLRAKDKSFNATLKTEYDETIGNINIIPQDMGRVILNLITNAFYAVGEKKKQQPDYEPIVTVATRSIKTPLGGLGVLISVKDNGNGIPQNVLDKIFQPFFTTKPTGKGTGLGLSMSYDIVTKGHGGELKVETKEGEGAQFIINLPV